VNNNFFDIKNKPLSKKTSIIIAVIGAIFVASINSFLFEDNLTESSVLLKFTYSFIQWVLILLTLQHIMANDKKDKYIKGAWVVGVYFLPLLFVPLYYYFRNSYSPKKLNPENNK